MQSRGRNMKQIEAEIQMERKAITQRENWKESHTNRIYQEKVE